PASLPSRYFRRGTCAAPGSSNGPSNGRTPPSGVPRKALRRARARPQPGARLGLWGSRRRVELCEDPRAVQLPLKIDIIKHPNETDGKSTAVHAKLLAPEFVNIYTYPCIPEYEEKDHEVALVFPGPKSISIKDLSFHLQKRIQNNVRDKNDPEKPSVKRKKTEEQDLNDSKGQDTTLKKIIFIDSTWNQTNKIFTDERLQGLLQVELKTRKTCFWRHQKGKPDTFLSTIEAIYYFLVDYHTDILKEKYQGQYDNLLFFYSFMYQLIKNAKCSGDKEMRKLIH
uniref:tRNA-uridine aminocarboxypropyltransferase 1 n=1 Tax=Felis catus TaxID=9685 RepID=A0ABI7Y7S4_FELCA